jgi:bifunctional DNase/RNase
VATFRAFGVGAVLGAGLLVALGAGCKARVRSTAPPGPASAVLAPPADPSPKAVSARPADSTQATAAAFADGGAPVGYERATVWDVVPSANGAAVLLLDSSRTAVLPIFVGVTEAITIELRMGGKTYPRPLTHDLLGALLRELGAAPVKVQVDDVRDDTFIGSVFVRQGERILQLDARPSDAIAIALGSSVPLYVSRAIMLSAGVPREDIDKAGHGAHIGPKHADPISL